MQYWLRQTNSGPAHGASSMKHRISDAVLGRGHGSAGFTLIELLVVVVIVGILAQVAYGAYQSQVRKARRSDAIASISSIQQAQERWRANCATYAASLTNPAPTDPATICQTTQGLGLAATTPGGYYTLAIASATATGYSVTASAAPGSSQAADTAGGASCAALTLNVANGAASSPSASAACWSK